VFIQCEDGLDELDVDKFPLAAKYDDVLSALAELRQESHEYETVVIDSLDWLERLVFDRLCSEHNTTSIEQVAGGYSKGYTLALSLWREIIEHLNALRNERGMVVLLIAHSKVERFCPIAVENCLRQRNSMTEFAGKSEILSDYAQTLIRVKARQMVRRPEFSATEAEDLEQELSVHLIANPSSIRNAKDPHAKRGRWL